MKDSGGNEAAPERPNRERGGSELPSRDRDKARMGFTENTFTSWAGYHSGAKDYRGNLSSKKRILESK